jgi:nicotinamidase-related amidase
MIALIIIDVQREYSASGALPVERFDSTVKNVVALLDAARKSDGATVVHVRHVSMTPGDSRFDASSPGLRFAEGVEPVGGEFVLTKQYPGAFSNPDLDRFLIRNGVQSVVICGLTSFLCCDTTAREAFQLGYKVYYVDDAISEFSLGDLSAAELHRAVSAVQGVMFSQVVNTSEAIGVLSGQR